jgi:hypothetical protein
LFAAACSASLACGKSSSDGGTQGAGEGGDTGGGSGGTLQGGRGGTSGGGTATGGTATGGSGATSGQAGEPAGGSGGSEAGGTAGVTSGGAGDSAGAGAEAGAGGAGGSDWPETFPLYGSCECNDCGSIPIDQLSLSDLRFGPASGAGASPGDIEVRVRLGNEGALFSYSPAVGLMAQQAPVNFVPETSATGTTPDGDSYQFDTGGADFGIPAGASVEPSWLVHFDPPLSTGERVNFALWVTSLNTACLGARLDFVWTAE